MVTQASDVQAKHENEWKYAARAMAWYGWGSPIGAGIFLVCAAATIALVRYAVFG